MIIYKTTNLINGKIYIGKDSKNNNNYLGSGILLKSAIKLYGLKNFTKEILEYCDSTEKLNLQEKYWIKYFSSNERRIGYNLTEGGDGGKTSEIPWNKGFSMPERTRIKISNSCKGGKGNTRSQKPWNKDKKLGKLSGDWKRKISIGNMGHEVTKETRNKISKGHIGKKLS